MKKTAVAVVVLASFAAYIGGAFGGTGTVWVLGKSGAVGKKAHAELLVIHVPAMYVGMATDKPRLIKRISVQALARPRQRVTAGYVLNCVPGGRGPGAHGKDVSGLRAPFGMTQGPVV